MHDLLIQEATVFDGSGATPFAVEVAIADGKIVEIGRITSSAHETIAAQGAWLTPGFVNIHSHYDGQARSDETF